MNGPSIHVPEQLTEQMAKSLAAAYRIVIEHRRRRLEAQQAEQKDVEKGETA